MMHTCRYPCILVFNGVYSCIVPVDTCAYVFIPTYSYVYWCLLVFTNVDTVYTCVYLCIPMYTCAYMCIPVYTCA